jgi:hypothetical protein
MLIYMAWRASVSWHHFTYEAPNAGLNTENELMSIFVHWHVPAGQDQTVLILAFCMVALVHQRIPMN